MPRAKDTQNNIRNRVGRTAQTAGLRPFKKGQSGNPGGRPKLPPEFKDALKAMVPESLEALRKAVNGKDLDTAVRAVNVVLNRLYGMPKQSVEQTGSPMLLLPDVIARRMGLSLDPKDYRAPADRAPETERPTDEGSES